MAIRLPPDPEGQDTFGEIENGHGYNVCVKYTWEGKESCRAIAQALAAWSSAEEAHAAALKKIANSYELPDFSETGSTLNTSWQAMKLGILHHSRNAQTFAKLLKAQEHEFVEYRHSQSKLKRKLESEKKTATSSLSLATNQTNKLKKKYVSACKAAESAINKRNTAGDDPKTKPEYFKKLNGKVEKCMKEVEKCDVNYQSQVDELNKEEEAYRSKMDHVLKELQVIEEDRVMQSKKVLAQTSEAAMAVFQNTMEGWDGVTQGVSAINVHTDMKRFVMRSISVAKSNAPDPPYLTYTNYEAFSSSTLDAEGRSSTRKEPPKPSVFKRSGTEASDNRKSGGEEKSDLREEPEVLTSTQKKGAAPPPHPHPVKSSLEGTSAEKEANSIAPPRTPHMSVDKRQLENVKETKVSAATVGPPKRSAPLPPSMQNTVDKPPGMDTPKNANDLEAATQPTILPPVQTSTETENKPKWVRANFDFEGEDIKDLSFIEGDLIEITDMTDKDWWKGKLHGGGEEGAFPSNYAELIFGTGDMKTGVAKYDFQSDEPGEISFQQGDSIEIIWMEDQSSGWWEGRCANGDGDVGMFPSNRVEVKK